MGWVILLVVLVGGYLAWRNRVVLLAKVLGQPESRIRRQLGGRDRD